MSDSRDSLDLGREYVFEAGKPGIHGRFPRGLRMPEEMEFIRRCQVAITRPSGVNANGDDFSLARLKIHETMSEVVDLIWSPDLDLPSESPEPHPCRCPAENFAFNGVGCRCGGV